MNVERIYSAYRDEAIAHQFTSEKYETFVAMPFKRLFSYNYERVLADVLKPAAVAANSLLETGLRCFAEPDVVRGRTATVITEDIIKDILFSHFFLGDLTFNNPGVLIESGVAMALKPNDQMILILDGDPRDLHFDIRNNRVLGYDINKIAEAMLQAALAFEKSRRLYFEELSLKLSPDAHLCLNQALQDQGILHRARIDFLSAAGEELQEDTKAIVNTMRYIDAVRELLAKRLVTTDWKVAITATQDSYSVQLTDLGKSFVKSKWSHVKPSWEQALGGQ